MFEGHSADKHAGNFLLVSMGGQAEGLACEDPGARTPIGASGNFVQLCQKEILSLRTKFQFGPKLNTKVAFNTTTTTIENF